MTDVSPAVPTPPPVKPWEQLGLSEAALNLIRKAGFERPTPVQSEAIPEALEGFDIIASAQTGTGKTATFVLPMVERIAGREGLYGIVLAPTREIAQQTQQTLELFGTPRGVRSIVLIGGVDMRYDTQALATYPQIIVATPGRLCDHLDRGNIWLEYIEMVVLDEADRMLDMGFSDQLNRIMQDVPKDRQTMLLSATMPPAVEALARRTLFEPKRIAIGRPVSAAHTVEQNFIWVNEEGKNRELRRLLREEPGSIIVFTRSKDGATRVWRSLHSAGVYDATYIHSDRLQSHREQALAEFKEGKYRILIATDVAGRGIHVDGVAHVINYDLPMEADDYVHRIGRTGRAGQTGKATTFLTGRDRPLVRQIEKIIGKPIAGEPPPREGGGDHDRHRSSRGGNRDRGHSRGGSSGGSHSRGASAASRVEQAPRAEASAPAASEGGAPREAGAATGPDGEQKRRRRRRGGRGRRGGGGGGGAPQGSGGGSSPQ